MGTNDAEGEDTANVEEDEAEDVALCCFWEVMPWVLHFTTCDYQQFWCKDEGERGGDEDTEEGDESTNVAASEEGLDCSWVLPVSKALNAILVRCSTPEDDK